MLFLSSIYKLSRVLPYGSEYDGLFLYPFCLPPTEAVPIGCINRTVDRISCGEDTSNSTSIGAYNASVWWKPRLDKASCEAPQACLNIKR